jgi:alcohol dehydrogenase class IV
MALSTFSFPTDIRFGAGAIQELGGHLVQLGIKRPLVVTDPGLLTARAFGSLQQALGRDLRDKQWFVFGGVHPNPIESDVTAAAAACREHGCDAIVAFGGGSPLDVGKATRLLLKQPGLKLADFTWQADWSGLVPLIAIPTTAGTGSEVGRSAVITIEATRRKAVLFNAELLARLAILDPELTVDLPPRLTAATGADALTHCIESFTSPVFHPPCDGVALEGVHLIADALPRAFRHGHDLEARGKMLVAAAMGAVAFQKDLGATHSLAHPLSTLSGLHHGTANALCLLSVMKFNAERKPGLYRRVGIACGIDVMTCSETEADQRTIAFISDLLRQIGLDVKLRELGVRAEQLDALTDQAFEDSCHKTNPVPVAKADLRRLYEQAL